MVDFLFLRLLAAALIALVPAAVAWWSGRRLIRLVDDPALPERLVANAQRRGIVTGVALVAIVALTGRNSAWLLMLMFISLMVGAYPLRKALYAETWSVAGYIAFSLRLNLAVIGFWLLIAFGPMLAATAGSLDWVAGILLAAVLFSWEAQVRRRGPSADAGGGRRQCRPLCPLRAARRGVPARLAQVRTGPYPGRRRGERRRAPVAAAIVRRFHGYAAAAADGR